MHFRSFEDLHRTIVKNLDKVPAETDLIVGIPRSGLLAANILALHLHLPVTDLDRFLRGRIMSNGERVDHSHRIKNIRDCENVLVVDDSLHRGVTLEKIKRKITNLFPDKNLTYSVVYAKPENKEKADIWFEECQVPRVFEWNLMNHRYLKRACLEIDGVLCRDPSPEENDNGEQYLHFLKNAEPFLRCRVPVGVIVTNRLEKYRKETEEWLQHHGIQYRELIMRNFNDQQTRSPANDYGQFKASVYNSYKKSKLFIESSYRQSKEIVQLTGKPVYCVDKRQMLYPDSLTAGKVKVKRHWKKWLKKPVAFFGKGE